MKNAIYITIILVSSFCVSARADMQGETRGVFTARYRSADSGKIDGIFRTIEDATQVIRNELGISMREPVNIVLARGSDDFERWAGREIPDWALAIARTAGADGGIVIDMSRTTPFLENNLHLVLRHELAHIALGQVERQAGRQFPLWFHEGTAVRISGGRHFTDRRPFIIAAAHGNQPALSDIEKSFPADRNSAEIAYLAAESFINFLASRCKDDSLSSIIDHFRDSGDIESSIEYATGSSLAELEMAWREKHRSNFPWLVTFWRSITLFSLISICVIIAFVIVYLRARRKKRLWLEEERLLGIADEEDDNEDDIKDYPELEDGPDYYEESLR